MKRTVYVLVFGAVLAACGSTGGSVASLTASRPHASTSALPARSPAVAIGSHAPRTLNVICVGKAIHLSSSVVQAQADGVHVNITFTSRSGGDFSYMSFNPDGSSGGSGIGVLSPGPWREVYPTVPGKASLRCAGFDAKGSSLDKGIEVLDPHHYWTPLTDPSCRRTSVEATAAGATAVDAARTWAASNGHPHDSIALLGYRASPSPTIGVSDHGKLVARVSVFSAATSTAHYWHISGEACATFQTPETLPR